MNDNPLKRKEGTPSGTGSVFYAGIEVLPLTKADTVTVTAPNQAPSIALHKPTIKEPIDAPRAIIMRESVVSLSEQITRMQEAIYEKKAA